MSDLPKEWRSANLAEIGIWLSGGTPFTDEPLYWNGDIPWISSASLKDFNISRSDRCVTLRGARAGTRLVPRGTVLFVVRGMSLKNEFRIGITERQVAFGQDCKAIIPNPGINGRFLAFAMKARSQEILCMVDEAGHGTGRLPTDLLAKLTVGLPESSEQRAIAEILETLDSQIRATEALLRKLDLLRNGIVQNALAEVFCYQDSSTVGNLFDIKSGITLGPYRKPAANASLYLRVANVQRGRIDLSDTASLQASASERKELQLTPGDLLVVEGHANSDEIGRCALVGPDAAGLLYQNHLFRLRSNRVDPEFAELWMNSDSARSYWRRMCTTSSGLYTINTRMLRALPFPIVDFEGQKEVVRVQRLATWDIHAQQKLLVKLRGFKQGLMDDLLTGRVRVPREAVERVETG
jgi:restriction endonuclease S subunit